MASVLHAQPCLEMATYQLALLQAWQGWSLTSCLLLPVFFYFLIQLRSSRKVTAPDDFHVLVIGAGPAGICAGKRLNDLGVR